MSLSTESARALFKGRYFNSEIVTLCVRGYITYKPSYRDLQAIMAERGISIAHTTIPRRGYRYVPEFVKRWQPTSDPQAPRGGAMKRRFGSKGDRGICIAQWTRRGRPVDFVLSEYRDSAAAQRFFAEAMLKRRDIPQKLTLDSYAASHVAVGELQEESILPATLHERTNHYLNNLIEQDHRRGKQRVRPMLDNHATTMITGIELVHQMKKGQFNVTALGSSAMRIQKV